MPRWTRTALLGLSLAAAAVCAQTVVREAPKDVKPAIIAVSATPPVITVDGKEDRLSPGARLRDRNNMLVLSGALAGQTLYTVYRRDGAGLVHEVWLLDEKEYAKVGGKYAGTPDGIRRFAELLDLVWAARAVTLLR
ncbi:hypothetical protein GCM10028796_40380 [Ramlibacter monticola]|jgi:hypothetical protein|uniref:Uncharacterized protein n=1 Tax=Ramlibacter monticola TaxID=1926872 RepID=A0A937CV65_9BURK|nr:hypothetical protein [Ramlibacter monticola]MBL0393454.1 hypothetical protein [Ramlibacter monticola]